MIRDASPDYSVAKREPADDRTSTVRTAARLAYLGGLVGAAGVGAGLVLMLRPVETVTVTEVLPLAPACAETIRAGEDFVATAPELDAAEEARDVAWRAWIEEVRTGTVDEIDAAFARLDDAKHELATIDAEHSAAGRSFLDDNNRCITDLDKVRRAATSRGADR